MVLTSNSRILITGGIGIFGKAFLAEIFCRDPAVDRVVIYSRDELKQSELQQHYPESQFPKLRFSLVMCAIATGCGGL